MEEGDAIVNAWLSGEPPFGVVVTVEEDLPSLLEMSCRE